MSGKWTPGPWYAIKMRGWGSQITISRKCQDDADNTVGDAPIAVVNEGASFWDDKYPYKENARLIAAAPELAEALEAMVERFGHDIFTMPPEDHDLLTRAADVLAKAKGEGA